jgi:hypothetical protein
VIQAERESLFSSLDDFGTDDLSDKLEEYLNTPMILTKSLDPLMWWHAIGESPLARMAIDFLSAPSRLCYSFPGCTSNLIVSHLASSCDVERGFSQGRLTVSKLHHSLSDESTRAATVLHVWSEIPGLIPEANIIQVFKDKCQQSNGKEQAKDHITVNSDEDHQQIREFPI